MISYEGELRTRQYEKEGQFPPLSRYGWVPTSASVVYRGVGLGCFRPLARYEWFPTEIKVYKGKASLRFRPLSRLGWGPTHFKHLKAISVIQFPSPREAWVVSYRHTKFINQKRHACFRPLARYAWFPTDARTNINKSVTRVSVPSRGMGGFLHDLLNFWMKHTVSVPSRGLGSFLQKTKYF